MSLIKVSAKEVGADHIRIHAPIVDYRIDQKQLLLYFKLADGSESEPIDLVPLLEIMWRMQREEG